MIGQAEKSVVIVVMGVSGSGKTTVATFLAAALGCDFQEGDDLHPRENVEQMENDAPLTLKAAAYDCVVVGGGLRLPPKSLKLFETVLNIIHKSAPSATIAFNTNPKDTAGAAARQLGDR